MLVLLIAYSYSPEYLVQQGVFVVTVNYRFSVLGFLYLPEAGIFGNAGLKDQVYTLNLLIHSIINNILPQLRFLCVKIANDSRY